jgi:hypothetical protein
LQEPTADFAFAQEFQLFRDHEGQRYVAEDASQRAVAFLPVGLGGEVRTRTDRWEIQTERRQHAWAVIARTIPDGAEAGGIAERVLPDTYKLWIAPDTVCHLTQNPLNGDWSIKDGQAHLARLTDIARFASRTSFRSSGRRVAAGTITTLEPPIHAMPLSLAIVLTLEMIKAEASIPSLRSISPAAY